MKTAALRHPARLAGASLLRLQSDARLAELAIAGHGAAFDAIVDRYRAPLLRYCAGITGPSRAEDAVQQTLINAHDSMSKTDEVRHLKSWLYRIAHNASLNVLRSVRDDVLLDEATVGSRAGAASAAAAADESFARSEAFRETLAALQALPERQRAALVLRELEGRSHEEIAAALGVTKGSARQHLMRARVAVRSAVTAVTPYPLVARFADLLSAAGGGAAPGWVDAAAGAGASATLMKLGAGVAATGALVGGAVGTQHVVRGGSSERATAAPAPGARTVERPGASAGAGVLEPAVKRAGAGVAGAPAGGARSVRVSLAPGASSATPSAEGRKPRARGPKTLPGPATTPAATRTPVAPRGTPDATTPATKAPGKGRHGRPGGEHRAEDHAGRENKSDHPDKPSSSNGRGPSAPRDDPGAESDKAKTKPSPSSSHGNSGKTGPSPTPASDDHSSSGKSDGKGNGSQSPTSSDSPRSPFHRTSLRPSPHPPPTRPEHQTPAFCLRPDTCTGPCKAT